MQLAYILLVLAGVNSTLGNFLLKYSRIVDIDAMWHDKLLSSYFIGAVSCYVVNLALFAKVLDYIPVSIGYPILASSSFAFLAISSYMLFKESFTIWQVIGLVLVIIGIFCLAKQ